MLEDKSTDISLVISIQLFVIKKLISALSPGLSMH